MDTLNDRDYKHLVESKSIDLMNTFYSALHPYTNDLKAVRAAVIQCVAQKRQMNNEIIHSDPLDQVKKNKLLLDMETFLRANKFETVDE